MTSTRIALTAAVLALSAAAAPVAGAATAAGPNKLMGSPSLRVLDGSEIAVTVPLDRKVARKHGRVQLTLTLSGRKVRHVGFSRTHGTDYVYAGSLPSTGFTVDHKYTLKITLPGQAPIVRKVSLKDL